MFSEFLRERIESLRPGEQRVASVLDQITARREALRIDEPLPAFLGGIYEEAEGQAQSALKKLRARKIREAKIALTAAIWYQELAERTVKQVKDIREKIQQATSSSNEVK